MKNRWFAVMGWIVIGLNLVGIGYFLCWLSKTDFMFGHFTGPPQWILTALTLCTLGVALSLAWLLIYLYRGLKKPRPAQASPQRRRWLAILQTVFLILLMFPSTIVVLVGFDEFPQARLKRRRGQVASQAKYLGTAAVPRLIKALEDEDPIVRDNAIQSLMKFGPRAKEAVPALARTLQDATKGGYADLIARDAAEALGRIGPDAESAIPALVDATRRGAGFSISGGTEVSEVDLVRAYSTEALANIGSAAIPALSELLTDENPNVRYWTVRALGEMGAGAKPAIPALIHALNDEEQAIREMIRIAILDCFIATESWSQKSGEGNPLKNHLRHRTLQNKIPSGDVLQLVELLAENDYYVRFGAMYALAEKLEDLDRLDPESKTAVHQALRHIAEDTHERADNRLLAALMVYEINSHTQSATPSLEFNLEPNDPLNALIDILTSPVVNPTES